MNEKITKMGMECIGNTVAAIMAFHFIDNIPIEECVGLYTEEIKRKVKEVQENEEFMKKMKALAILFGGIQ